MKLAGQKSPVARIIESVLIGAFKAVIVVCVSALGGFWWLVDGMTLWEGTIMMLGITAFSFNRVPSAGWALFLNREVLFLYLPVWLINVIGYIIGFGISA